MGLESRVVQFKFRSVIRNSVQATQELKPASGVLIRIFAIVQCQDKLSALDKIDKENKVRRQLRLENRSFQAAH